MDISQFTGDVDIFAAMKDIARNIKMPGESRLVAQHGFVLLVMRTQTEIIYQIFEPDDAYENGIVMMRAAEAALRQRENSNADKRAD